MLLFLRQMIPLGVDYVEKPLWCAVFLIAGVKHANGYSPGQGREPSWVKPAE